jgi:hypothetical protein
LLAGHLSARIVEPPRAQMSQQQAKAGERVSLVVVVGVDGDEQDLPWPEIPLAPGLAVVDKARNQSTSDQTSIINGHFEHKRVVTVQFQFQIAADKPGTYAVGPISYQGYDLGRGQLAVVDAPQDVRIATLVGKRVVYVGQQVPFTWRLEADRPFEVLKFPDVRTALGTGFYIETPDSQQLKAKVVEERGRRLIRADLAGSVFPVRAGRQPLPATSMDYRIVERGAGMDPIQAMMSGMDPFDAMMGRSRVTQGTARTQELQLDIRPVPDKNRPASFQGGVGAFHLESRLEKEKLRAGDGTTLTIVLEGTGQPQASGLPLWNPPSGVETYPPQDTWTRTWKDGVLWTRLSRKIVLVPRSSGRISPDSVRFAWFDPAAGKFHSASVGLPSLAVDPAPAAAPAADTASRRVGAALSRSDRFWIVFGKVSAILWSILLLCGIAWAAVAWIRVRLSPEHAQRRALRALEKRLSSMPPRLPTQRAATELARLLFDALAVRLGEDAKALSSEEIPGALVDGLSWPEPLARSVGALCLELQAVQFAGAPLTADIRSRLGNLLHRLRPEKRKKG